MKSLKVLLIISFLSAAIAVLTSKAWAVSYDSNKPLPITWKLTLGFLAPDWTLVCCGSTLGCGCGWGWTGWLNVGLTGSSYLGWGSGLTGCWYCCWTGCSYLGSTGFSTGSSVFVSTGSVVIAPTGPVSINERGNEYVKDGGIWNVFYKGTKIMEINGEEGSMTRFVQSKLKGEGLKQFLKQCEQNYKNIEQWNGIM